MSEGKHHHIHTQDFKIYLGILMALITLTVFTVWIATFDFGRWNDVIAMGVAGIKASLVVLFFMHGRFENRMTWAFIYYPLIILGILLAALFLDYGTRPSDIYLVGNVIAQEVHHGEEGHSKGSDDHGTTGDHQTPADHDDAATHDSGEESHTAETTPDSGEAEATHEGTAPTEDQPAAETTAAVDTAGGWGSLPGGAVAGKAKANTICIACHVIDGVGNALPGAPPFEESANLERMTPEYLRKWFKDPAGVKPGTLMPNFGLPDNEIEDLIAFLATYKK